MRIDNIVEIFFSPTDTTKKIISEIAKGMEIEKINTINLTKLDTRKSFNPDFTVHDLLIIGVPVYEERIPEIMEEPLSKLKGQGQPVVIITLYGNIGAGIALKQLYSLVRKAGFKVVGAASFIGEHSFSNNELKIASGRPDEGDLKEAKMFGEKIIKKLNELNDIEKAKELKIEGKLPLMAKVLPRNSAKMFAEKPMIDNEKCNQCGICVAVCPTMAIDNNLEINEELCLRCFACVKKCPEKARQINFKKKWLVKNFLKKNANNRKEPIMYL